MVLILVSAIVAFVVIKDGAGNTYNALIGWMGIVVLIWCALSSKVHYKSYFSLVFMFEISFYILTLGQSMLYALGIPLNSTLDLYIGNPTATVNKAYLFTIFCLLLLHLGILTYSGDRKKAIRFTFGSHKHKERIEIDYTKAMRTAGWILFPITLICYGYQAIQLFSVYSVAGYRAAYISITGVTSWGKIFDLIGYYFPFVLFLLLAAYRNDGRMRNTIMTFILLIVLFNFAIGNRSEPICYAMAALWFYKRYSETKMQRRRATVMMVVGAFVIILIIPIIGETRNTGELSFDIVVNSLTGKNSLFSTIQNTIIGMGWSAFPTIKTMQLIPSQFGYHFGQSYFFALLSVVPNLLGGTHISVMYAGLPQWLMNVLHMNYGPGFSMPAEAYYNFGWFGVVVAPFLGYLIAKILDERQKDESAMRTFVLMGGFIILFSFPRREMLTVIRNITYNLGFLYLFVLFLHRQLKINANAVEEANRNA
jgi:oligosaccharide repeat unit polymerase